MGEVYTPLNQLDFAAELAQVRAAKPDALYIFYPGGLAVSFLKQFDQAGLKTSMALIGPSYSLDQTVLPAVGKAAVGAMASAFWTESLDNPANRAFTAAFKAEYRRSPSPYAAVAYDTARALGAALDRTGGNVADHEALRAALAKAPFESVRGSFRFGANQFPVQNYYLTEIVQRPDGTIGAELRGDIFQAHADAYGEACKMRPF